MIAVGQQPRLTPQAYLDWEVQQPLRYEYFDGQVFAMAGGTLPHADIALIYGEFVAGASAGAL